MAIPRSSLEQWAVLAAVVDEGGFAPAATALHRSQSAVSYAIARLQSALSVPLLVIAGRRAVLTPEGQTLLARAAAAARSRDARAAGGESEAGLGKRAQAGGGCGLSARAAA